LTYWGIEAGIDKKIVFKLAFVVNMVTPCNYSELIKSFSAKDWEKMVVHKLRNIEPLSKKLKRER